MRKLAVLLVLTMVVGLFTPVMAENSYQSAGDVQAEARQGFEQILDLWRDGKYGELYERTIRSGTETKERFAARLDSASLKPACCWEMMQDVQVTVKKENVVTLRARIGLNGAGTGEYKTRSFKLIKEDGVWKVSRADILSLSGATKRKRYSHWK